MWGRGIVAQPQLIGTVPEFRAGQNVKGGYLHAPRIQPDDEVETPDHFLNWLECLRSRKACNAPIEAGYNHCVPALMAMRAFDTGRRQVYDAAKQEIREG